MNKQAIESFADGLERERAIKGFLFILIFLSLVIMGPRSHPYVPIVMFAMLADLFALNRLRRFVTAVRTPAPKAAQDVDDDEDE